MMANSRERLRLGKFDGAWQQALGLKTFQLCRQYHGHVLYAVVGLRGLCDSYRELQ